MKRTHFNIMLKSASCMESNSCSPDITLAVFNYVNKFIQFEFFIIKYRYFKTERFLNNKVAALQKPGLGPPRHSMLLQEWITSSYLLLKPFAYIPIETFWHSFKHKITCKKVFNSKNH